MAADAPTVPAPTAAALVAEADRYLWWAEKWTEIDADSRASYDRWVAGARGARAERRARLVTRRLWHRRPWAGLVKRRLQACWDFLDNGAEAMPADAAVGPAGWAP